MELLDNQTLPWDKTVDLLIVGSGAGSICAALIAKDRGLQPLIVEKLPVVGGTTAYSGGAAWIPNNPLMAREGIPDSYERSREYMDAAVWYEGPCTTPAKRDAFLRNGPKMIEYLEGKGMQFCRPKNYPDYHSDLPGGEQSSRSVTAKLFNLNELGPWKEYFAGTARPPLRFHAEEAVKLSLLKRSWGSRFFALRIALRLLFHKLAGHDLRGTGAALQGRLLQIAIRENIPIWREAPVEKLLCEDNRVAGVQIYKEDKPFRIKASHGVLLNAGGFALNKTLREQYSRKPVSGFTGVSPGDTGEMLEAAMELGAATDIMDEGLWAMGSMFPDGTFPGGSAGPDANPPPGHHFDISLPHCIMVDQNGKRFTNEAASYMEVGQNFYRRHDETGKGIPAYAIIESRHRDSYSWGMTLGKTPQSWLDSGYMKKADSLEQLAEQCGIDVTGLRETIGRFNSFCITGIDEDYKRGGKAFDNCHGDPTVRPNPNLGAIEKPPFYAVAIYPGDVGTWGGLVTDENARVIGNDGAVIEGLYATGTTAASVFGRTYPGAGASIGPAMVFGYIAAQHACNTKPEEK